MIRLDAVISALLSYGLTNPTQRWPVKRHRPGTDCFWLNWPNHVWWCSLGCENNVYKINIISVKKKVVKVNGLDKYLCNTWGWQQHVCNICVVNAVLERLSFIGRFIKILQPTRPAVDLFPSCFRLSINVVRRCGYNNPPVLLVNCGRTAGDIRTKCFQTSPYISLPNPSGQKSPQVLYLVGSKCFNKFSHTSTFSPVHFTYWHFSRQHKFLPEKIMGHLSCFVDLNNAHQLFKTGE